VREIKKKAKLVEVTCFTVGAVKARLAFALKPIAYHVAFARIKARHAKARILEYVLHKFCFIFIQLRVKVERVHLWLKIVVHTNKTNRKQLLLKKKKKKRFSLIELDHAFIKKFLYN
jgi:hypothetical protein